MQPSFQTWDGMFNARTVARHGSSTAPHSEVHDEAESITAAEPPESPISDDTAPPTDAYAGWEDSAQETIDDTPPPPMNRKAGLISRPSWRPN